MPNHKQFVHKTIKSHSQINQRPITRNLFTKQLYANHEKFVHEKMTCQLREFSLSPKTTFWTMKDNLSFYLRAAQKKTKVPFPFPRGPAAQLIYKLPEYIFLLPQISTINQYIFFKRYRKRVIIKVDQIRHPHANY